MVEKIVVYYTVVVDLHIALLLPLSPELHKA